MLKKRFERKPRGETKRRRGAHAMELTECICYGRGICKLEEGERTLPGGTNSPTGDKQDIAQ